MGKFHKEKCFFCQEDTDQILHPCLSPNRGKNITEIVQNSSNDKWKTNLAEVISCGGLLSRDFVYHHLCYTRNWKKYIQKKNTVEKVKASSEPFHKENNEELILVAAELEFMSIIQSRIDSHEYIQFSVIKDIYVEIIQRYGISNLPSDYHLKQKLLGNIENIVITQGRGSKPALVHSKDAGSKAIHDRSVLEEQTPEARLKSIFQCGKLIRNAIKESQEEPWAFEGSLKNNLKTGVQLELVYLIQWIIQGASYMKTEVRKESSEKACYIIGHHIIQEFKSDRQVQFTPKSSSVSFRSSDTPLAVGLSLHNYHNHRRKNEIYLLNKCGTGISYDHMNDITCKIASNVQSNMQKNIGVFVPSGLLKNIPITCSVDNIDAKVDTVDGHNTFHGTAIAVHQKIPHDASQFETVSVPFKIEKDSPTNLQNIPTTVTEMVDCHISGNPKPKKSPIYKHFKLSQYNDYVTTASKGDIGWLLSRYSQRVSSLNCNNGVPVWSAYNSLI